MLQSEGIAHFEPLAPAAFNEQLRETLLCFVLMGPAAAHAFCSRYDFGPWPLLPGVDRLPADVHKVCSADPLALEDHSMPAILQAQLLLQPHFPSDLPEYALTPLWRSCAQWAEAACQAQCSKSCAQCCAGAAGQRCAVCGRVLLRRAAAGSHHGRRALPQSHRRRSVLRPGTAKHDLPGSAPQEGAEHSAGQHRCCPHDTGEQQCLTWCAPDVPALGSGTSLAARYDDVTRRPRHLSLMALENRLLWQPGTQQCITSRHASEELFTPAGGGRGHHRDLGC